MPLFFWSRTFLSLSVIQRKIDYNGYKRKINFWRPERCRKKLLPFSPAFTTAHFNPLLLIHQSEINSLLNFIDQVPLLFHSSVVSVSVPVVLLCCHFLYRFPSLLEKINDFIFRISPSLSLSLFHSSVLF